MGKLNRVVFKYPIKLVDRFELHMPKGAKILSVQEQGGSFYLWAIVNEKADKEYRVFHVIGTGNTFNSHGIKYITTIQTCDGVFIWHIFDGGKYNVDK